MKTIMMKTLTALVASCCLGLLCGCSKAEVERVEKEAEEDGR